MTICALFKVQFSTSFYNIYTKKYQNIYTFKKKERKKERNKIYFKNINLPCEEFLDTSFDDNESIIYTNTLECQNFPGNQTSGGS